MRSSNLITTALVLVLSVVLGDTVFAQRGSPRAKQRGQTTAVLTADEAATLTFMREEEKLARDVYDAMYGLWETGVFANIAESEQRHMDALLKLLNKYGLPDPAQGPGVFLDETLQALYQDLLALGTQSELDALLVGALVEEVDIEDLQDAIQATDNVDLQRVYSHLLRGSENHLRAFASHVESLTGEAYEAQWLDSDVVDSILEGANRHGAGQPWGRARR